MSSTGVMIKAFVAKMVFFGGYVALIVKAGWVQPVPFAISLRQSTFLHYILSRRFACDASLLHSKGINDVGSTTTDSRTRR